MKYFQYKHVNCFFVESPIDDKILAIDAGWPCSLHEYCRNLKSIGLKFDRISWAIVTHFHMDHAGLIGEFIDHGINCLVFENQKTVIDEMERVITKNKNEYKGYKRVNQDRLISVKTSQSREYLAAIGITGEVILTNGHSPDSITYITNKDEAIIGDLYPFNQVMENDVNSISSWELIRKKSVKHVYPSHAEPFDI